jgi:transposase
MVLAPFRRLTDAEKDALLLDQQALIERLAARISELEGLVGKPRKTSSNSHKPPSKDDFCSGGPRSGKGGMRASREGKHRPLTAEPDKTERVMASACGNCGTDVSGHVQHCRHRYDHIDLPPIRPIVTRIELLGGRCRGCGGRFRAQSPEGMAPGSPFGPGIRTLLAYLHHSHHVSFEPLSRLSRELLGLTISEGAIANMFRRLQAPMADATKAIRDRLRDAAVIASDETTTRINGITKWQWVFHSSNAVLHKIVGSRARAVPEAVLGGHQPDVWISDRYSGQQQLGRNHQVCLAHVLRDVQYAIDCGDTVFAPKIRDHLRWVIGIGRRRHELKDSTLASYAAKADNVLDKLVTLPVAHPNGQVLQRQVKAWRQKFFVFMTNRDVPATNNGSEREIRPSVVFRKVTNGFRSDWGAEVHAGYRSVTGTARLHGKSAIDAIRDLTEGRLALA